MVKILTRYRWFVCATVACMGCFHSMAQNKGLLQDIDLADTARILQLTDSVRAQQYGLGNRSFMMRPFIMQPVQQAVTKLRGSIDNISFSTYYNDSLGTGYNNGSFFQATGWQQRFSLGASLQLGRLLIRVQPELVFAQNKAQAAIDNSFNVADFFSRYYYMNINVIDLPSRYGRKALSKLYPGQSSVRYFIDDHFSAGISTENIWWGPGTFNSLIMTNNAPGFIHATAETHTPIETPIGSFEGQLIVGRLDSSGVEPVENERQFSRFWGGAYVPKIASVNRSIVGATITWQPKWIPHLFVGFAASTYFYNHGSDTFGIPFPDYPWTASTQKRYSASMGSIFFRYAMPRDHAEFYAEVGRGDKAATLFNLFGDTIPLAYTIGLRKLLPLRDKQFIELHAELTHLQLPDPRLTFAPANPYSVPKNNTWYTHTRVRQGYTHFGQMLGAGIGPGSNSQNLSVSWVNGIKKLGLQIERVIHNEDFYYYQYIPFTIGSGYTNRHWVDLSFGIHAQYPYKNLMFAFAYTNTSALNYQWVKVDGLFDGPSVSDKRNHNIVFSVSYRFGKKLSF